MILVPPPGRCPTPGKTSIRYERAARWHFENLFPIHSRERMEMYLCECGWWHFQERLRSGRYEVCGTPHKHRYRSRESAEKALVCIHSRPKRGPMPVRAYQCQHHFHLTKMPLDVYRQVIERRTA